MNQINKSECIEVGYIQKPHGLKGEVILIPAPEYKDTFEDIEFLFIDIDGGLVPFFIEQDGLRFRNNDCIICSLGFVDSLTKAKELVGCNVFVFNREIVVSEENEDASYLIGMKAYDNKYGEIGLISRVDDFSGNLVITVNNPRAEILISLSDEVVNSVSEERREIFLNCPDGLIEMYLK